MVVEAESFHLLFEDVECRVVLIREDVEPIDGRVVGIRVPGEADPLQLLDCIKCCCIDRSEILSSR